MSRVRVFCISMLIAATSMACLFGVAQAPPVPRIPATPSRFVVVLDAAHGGDDAGALLGPNKDEKSVTLAISVRLRSLLAARGFTVITTRETNGNVENNLRAQIANHAAASACLSLHASTTGSGVHLFVSSLAPTAPTRFLAWKTAQSAYVVRSLKLASTVNSAIEHSTDSTSGTAPDANSDSSTALAPIPVTLARTSLPVVDSMACPALALEIAPLRGADHQAVTDPTDIQYQTQIAAALAAALLEWRTDIQSDATSGARQP